MFDASRKFNVEIRNAGTEPIIVKTVEAPGRHEAAVRRVCGDMPAPQTIEPGQSIVLIGYEPGVSHKIEPGLRSPVYVSERVLAELAEHIMVAARRLTDEHGLRVRAPLPGDPLTGYDVKKVLGVARQAIAEMTGCEIEQRDAIDG